MYYDTDQLRGSLDGAFSGFKHQIMTRSQKAQGQKMLDNLLASEVYFCRGVRNENFNFETKTKRN
jgi:hypothetical protein